jgi:acyl-CoA hydrolase|tara:strand:- start:3967 stop:4476 length:510 start_codon:yes stop_codon:yes gene_type:complete
MEPKSPQASKTIMTDTVLPSETNTIHTLFGGELLARMDRAASISAQRHSGQIVVTASVNHVAFKHSVPLGSIVTIEAKVSRAFKSSMEVYIDVWVDNNAYKKHVKVNEAIFTFVAVNDKGNPVLIPKLVPESDEEIQRYEGALRRKQLSLVLAGKMKAQEATELKALFE